MPLGTDPRFLALCGGVGGAKLADGLARILPPQSLTLAVNVGDDFDHCGLPICPDIDTVLYTLAGVAHPQQGWGRADESWRVFAEIVRLGEEAWFQLGDLDIALHLIRRSLLVGGRTLSETTRELARRLGVVTTVAPITDDPLRTVVHTPEGELPFQHYFVQRRCEPKVLRLEFQGAGTARLAPVVAQVLDDPQLAGVIVCPSNPYLSIAPMLAVDDLRERLQNLRVPVIAVSPIVAGKALKGPAAKMMAELGVAPTAATVADIYRDFITRVVIHHSDSALAQGDSRLHVAATVMNDVADRIALARTCIELVVSLLR